MLAGCYSMETRDAIVNGKNVLAKTRSLLPFPFSLAWTHYAPNQSPRKEHPMIDVALLNAQLIHTIKIVAECVTAAAFLSFLWIVLPACRKGGPRR